MKLGATDTLRLKNALWYNLTESHTLDLNSLIEIFIGQNAPHILFYTVKGREALCKRIYESPREAKQKYDEILNRLKNKNQS